MRRRLAGALAVTAVCVLLFSLFATITRYVHYDFDSGVVDLGDGSTVSVLLQGTEHRTSSFPREVTYESPYDLYVFISGPASNTAVFERVQIIGARARKEQLPEPLNLHRVDRSPEDVTATVEKVSLAHDQDYALRVHYRTGAGVAIKRNVVTVQLRRRVKREYRWPFWDALMSV